jgi:hypothetical protein
VDCTAELAKDISKKNARVAKKMKKRHGVRFDLVA